MKNRILCYTKAGTLAYTLTESNIMNLEYVQTVNPTERLQLGVAASAQITVTTKSPLNKDWVLRLQKMDPTDSDWKQLGVFYIQSIDSDSSGTYIIQAYDAMSLFDLVLNNDNDFWTNVNDETVGSFVTNYIDSKSIELDNSVVWKNYAFPVDLRIHQSHTGRNFLQWTASLEGGFAYIRPNGKLYIGSYRNTNKTLGPSQYKAGTMLSEIPIKGVDCIVFAGQSNNYAIYKTNTFNNVLSVKNNQLIISVSSDYKNTYNDLEKLHDRMFALGDYYTGTIALFEDYGIECGDIITVNGKKFPVMTKTITAEGVTLSSTGSDVAEGNVWENSSIQGALAQLPYTYAPINILTSSDNKQINGNITFGEDILMNGLDYYDVSSGTDYSDNKSLKNVIQYILKQLNSKIENRAIGDVFNSPQGPKLFSSVIYNNREGSSFTKSSDPYMNLLNVTVANNTITANLTGTPPITLGHLFGILTVNNGAITTNIYCYYASDISQLNSVSYSNLFNEAISITYHPINNEAGAYAYDLKNATSLCNYESRSFSNRYIDVTVDNIIRKKGFKFKERGFYAVTVHNGATSTDYLIYADEFGGN